MPLELSAIFCSRSPVFLLIFSLKCVCVYVCLCVRVCKCTQTRNADKRFIPIDCSRETTQNGMFENFKKNRNHLCAQTRSLYNEYISHGKTVFPETVSKETFGLKKFLELLRFFVPWAKKFLTLSEKSSAVLSKPYSRCLGEHLLELLWKKL